MTTKTTPHVERLPFLIGDIHPEARPAFHGLIIKLFDGRVWESNGANYILRPFEGFRTPARQHKLLTVDKTTKVGPWKSAHQYGLAVDFAGVRMEENRLIPGTWTWNLPDEVWGDLQIQASKFSLRVPISWDKGHVEHPMFADLKRAWSIRAV